MSDNNSPYATPNAELGVASEVNEFNDAGVFSLSGRIGRLRYLAYFFSIYIFIAFIAGVFGAGFGFSSDDSELAGGVFLIFLVIGYIAFFFYTFVFSRRRLNDLGWSGWWNLLFIVPLVNLILSLILIFKAGEQGANQYGNPAPANTLGIKIMAFLFPGIAIVGILAAIAIPAYQDYVTRAQTIQSQQ